MNMASYWLFLLLNAVLLLTITWYIWKRRHLYRISSSLPGPFALPIIGNGLKFLGVKPEDGLTVVVNFMKQFPERPIRFWMGPYLMIYFSDPEHIEKILSSNKLTHKHDIYDMLKVYLGKGLISNSGPLWKLHRRIIQPLFGSKFVAGYTNSSQEHINICMEHLEHHVNLDKFDIFEVLHMCFVDIVGESILGTKIESQKGKNHEFVQAATDIFVIANDRTLKPWLHPDWIYNLTNKALPQNKTKSIIRMFYRQAIHNARERVTSYNNNKLYPDDLPLPIVDQMVNAADFYDFIDHLATLFYASEDTMSTLSSFMCMYLGMHPQYQTLAANEIREVVGEKTRNITYQDISKLIYLDMCTKDTLRLVPVGPLLVRKTLENFELGGKVYPKDCAITVGIFEVHRSPKYWEHPETFYPDHFLPDAVRNRHPYAFIPFSAGPRNCIGKTMAYTFVKLLMANLLHRFEVQAEGTVSDLILKADVVTRSKNGYKIKLRQRSWK